MKAEVKAFGRGPRADLREKCGRLDMRAQNEEDAVLLARLAHCLFYGTPAEHQRLIEAIKA